MGNMLWWVYTTKGKQNNSINIKKNNNTNIPHRPSRHHHHHYLFTEIKNKV